MSDFKQVNLDNPIHQAILVNLALIYYSCGDVKSIWEPDSELLYGLVYREFELKNDGELCDWLNSTKHLWEAWPNLKMCENSDHMSYLD